MSVISTVSKNVNRNTKAAGQTAVQAETSEFDGFWLNLGVSMGTEEDSTFVRLPRGVAVSDLKVRKVYESMDPEYAAQVNLMNRVISLIQGKCKGLAEGESIPVNLEVVLYRKQEESEVAAAPEEISDLDKALFG